MFRARPRFTIEVDSPADLLMDRVRANLEHCPRCTGVSVGRHAELFVPEADQRLWSPWLSVSTEERGSGSVLKGRFAPHPSIWTLYLFLTFALGFALLVGLSWGYAQWVMQSTPWALLTLPATVVLGGLLYLVSVIGQRLGAQQMDQLKAALEELIEP
jgi:hypothetical protein